MEIRKTAVDRINFDCNLLINLPLILLWSKSTIKLILLFNSLEKLFFKQIYSFWCHFTICLKPTVGNIFQIYLVRFQRIPCQGLKKFMHPWCLFFFLCCLWHLMFLCLLLFVYSGGKNTSADQHTATCATMSWMVLVASKVYSACVSLLNKLWKYVLVSMVEEIITLFLLIFLPTFVIIHLIFSILVQER